MCGWLRLEMVFASRSKRCLKSGFAARSEGRILMATSRSRRLDGDLAFETRVLRPVDLAHAARAERADDLVGAESSFCF
ncbi:MAG: hypothetical protein P8018_14150 [Acidobacteriota bacterium]